MTIRQISLQQKNSRLRRAFTLVELMVVVVIMGVLAALVVPRLMGRTDDARVLAATFVMRLQQGGCTKFGHDS